jgi:hypothetical protein
MQSVSYWQFTHTSAGCSENGIGQRRRNRRHSGLTYTCWWRLAFNQVNLRFGCHTDAQNPVVIEISLHNAPVPGSDLAVNRQAEPENHRPLLL